MASVKAFSNNSKEQTVPEIVEDTGRVTTDGSVTFRTSLGKGSGRAVHIPGDQFDEFVGQMNELASTREEKATLAREEEAAALAAEEAGNEEVPANEGDSE
jgi:hypothetical protein